MYGTLTIPIGRAAIYGTIDADTEKFSPAINRYVYEFGLRQILANAHAQSTDKDGKFIGATEIRAKVERRLATLLAGEMRVRNEDLAVDAKTTIVYTLLREALLTKWRATGTYSNFPPGTKNRFLFHANKLCAQKGKPECKTEHEYLDMVLLENPQTRERFERRADEEIAKRKEDLGIEI